MNRKETLEQILKFTSDYYFADVEKVKTGGKKQELVSVRQLYTYLAKMHHLRFSHREIAEILGRDHATSVHSIKMVNNRCQVDRDFNEQVKELAVEFSKEFQSIVKVEKLKTVKGEKMEALRDKCANLELVLENKQKLILEQMQELTANSKELNVLRNYYNKTHKLPEVLKLLNS